MSDSNNPNSFGPGMAGAQASMPTPQNRATGFQYIDTGTVRAREEQELAESTPDKKEDNDGQSFDGAAFWKGPEGDKSPGSGTGSPADDSSSSGQPGNENQQNPVDALNAKIKEMDFGIQEFTESEVSQINNGDNTPLMNRITDASREAVRQTIMTIAPMMQQMQTGIMDQVNERINSSIQHDRATQTLQSEILAGVPEANRASVSPVAEAVFAQALKNSDGDRQKAVTESKAAIRNMVEGLAGSLDLSVAAPTTGTESPDTSTEGGFDWNEFSGLTRP